jgi:hypothetical protein
MPGSRVPLAFRDISFKGSHTSELSKNIRWEVGVVHMRVLSLGTVLASILALTALGATPAQAQVGAAPSLVPAGKSSLIYGFMDCHGNPPMASGTATNGTITSRSSTRNLCGNPQQPVTEVIYTQKPGFKGEDFVTVYAAGGYFVQKKVLVR